MMCVFRFLGKVALFVAVLAFYMLVLSLTTAALLWYEGIPLF
jgi:hypothetical protein